MGDEEYREGLLYDGDHTWVRIEGEYAYLGVTKPAASKVDEFVFIQLPAKGTKIRKGETYVTLEAIKWSGHLASPLGGEIDDVNSPLFDEPSQINRKPYDSWIVKLKMADKSEAGSLIDAAEAASKSGRR
jgi:glycine cleavage system H protein